ncbi:MAG: asparaginase domain-containing protein [Bdellovibrionales bacterium]
MDKINIDDLKAYILKLTFEDQAEVLDLLAEGNFVKNEKWIAIFACGGTIQSAYLPEAESIWAVPFNPALTRLDQLKLAFGIAEEEVTGAIICSRDSRDLSLRHGTRLLNTISMIPNRRVIVTCGTYKLPIIAEALDHHFGRGRSNKIIGVTGAMLPPAISTQDGDFNVGGVLAAVNALQAFGHAGVVFAHFHGRIYHGDRIKEMNLHPERSAVGFAAMTPSVIRN